jgi:hypothetical protein
MLTTTKSLVRILIAKYRKKICKGFAHSLLLHALCSLKS